MVSTASKAWTYWSRCADGLVGAVDGPADVAQRGQAQPDGAPTRLGEQEAEIVTGLGHGDVQGVIVDPDRNGEVLAGDIFWDHRQRGWVRHVAPEVRHVQAEVVGERIDQGALVERVHVDEDLAQLLARGGLQLQRQTDLIKGHETSGDQRPHRGAPGAGWSAPHCSSSVRASSLPSRLRAHVRVGPGAVQFRPGSAASASEFGLRVSVLGPVPGPDEKITVRTGRAGVVMIASDFHSAAPDVPADGPT